MSKPKPPYYYKEGKSSDCYHWEEECSQNYYPAKGWVKDDNVPKGREQCNQCKAKN